MDEITAKEEAMKKIRHTYDSIVLAVCFCAVAMVCGLLAVAIATSDISLGPTAIDTIFASTLFGGISVILIFLAFYALADGRTKERRL